MHIGTFMVYPCDGVHVMAHKAAIVVPTTHEHAEHAISQVKDALTHEYGGCSVYRGNGQWKDESAVVEEEHARIETTAEALNAGFIRKQARFVKTICNEDAVYTEITEVDVTYV